MSLESAISWETIGPTWNYEGNYKASSREEQGGIFGPVFRAMATSEVGNVNNDNTSRPTPSSGSNGLDVLSNNPAFAGSGPNVNNFKVEKEFPYNGSSDNMNNSMDPSGNSSATKHRPRPNVMNSTSPNNGPVPGGTMNPQPTGAPAPNVDPFSDGVNLPPDAMMNKGGIGYGMGPGGGGDAFGNAGGYGYGRNPNFAGMPNQLAPGNDVYQGPGANPSNPMPNSSYNQYDPMSTVRNFNAPTPVSRAYPSQYPGPQSNLPQPRVSSSQRAPGSERISSSAPTLSQLLQGQKTHYNFTNNFPQQNDVAGRGPDGGSIPNQYWAGPRSSSSMANQMPVGYPSTRNQMNLGDSHMISRRPYAGSSPMGPGAPPYSQQQSMQPYMGNRQYPQMYPQQMHRAPVSRAHYGPQPMPPPYGPQSQGMNFVQQQQQQQQTQAGFGSHVQPPSQEPYVGQPGSTPVPQQQTPSQPQPQMPQQQPQPPQPGPTPTMSQQQQHMHHQQQLQQQQMQQQQQQQHQQQQHQQSYPSVQPQQPANNQQQASWPPHTNQLQQQDVPSSQALSQTQVKEEPSTPQSQSAMTNRAPTPQAAPQAASQETKSQVAAIQDQETAGNRPSSLPDLSGCIDDLSTEGDSSNQTSNCAPVNNQSVPNSSDTPPVAPADSSKPKLEPVSNPPSQPQTPVPQPSGAAAVKPTPSPVGSPASLVSRTSQSPASANSGSVTPQPQMPLSQGHGMGDKSGERLSQSPSMQPSDMKGSNMPMTGGYPQHTMPPPYSSSSMTRFPNHTPGHSQDQSQASMPPAGYLNYHQNPYGSPGNMSRTGFRGGQPTPYGTSSAMGNMNYDSSLRPGPDQFGNSQACNDFNSNSMVSPGQAPGPNMRSPHSLNSSPGMSMNMNTGNPFPPNYTGGGSSGGGTMGYKPPMPNAHGNVPHRLDGPYSGSSVQRFPLRGPSMPQSSMAQANMMQGDTRQPGSYPPPYPQQQQQQQQQPWPPMQQANAQQGQIPPGAGQFKSEVPFEPTNSFQSQIEGRKPQQPAVTTSSVSITTQNLTDSSTATSTTAMSMANSVSDTRNTSVTQSITMPVSTPNTVSSSTIPEHLPMNQSSVSPSVKKESEDGSQQIKVEANSLPPLSQPLNQPSPMASPSTLSKSSQEDVTSGTASPVPPSAGTPTPRPGNQTPSNKKANNGSSNGLVLNRKVMKLYELSDDPNRKIFLDTLLKFMEDRGQPIKNTPQVASHVLDLFRLYHIVKEKGGVVKVSKSKQWKQIASTLAIGNSNSAAYTLKKNYIRYLLPYECFFERNGLDPAHIIAEIDTSTTKKPKNSKKSGAATQQAVAGGPMFNNGPYDQCGPRHSRPGYPYPNQMPMYPPMGHPRGPMPNNTVPQMPNNMGNNITVRDPFSEMDAPHMSGGNAPYNPNMGNNAYGGHGGHMAPGQFRTSSMPNNEMYNQNMYGMRNSGMPPNPDPYGMGRRDMTGGKPEAFNRSSPMTGASDPYLGANQGGSVNLAPSTNSAQYQQGSHERPFISPSPSNPPQQGSTVPPPMSGTTTNSSNSSSSMQPDPQVSMGQPGNYRYPSPSMGTRVSTPNSQTYPPPPYSGGASMPYSSQQPQPPTPQGPSMAQTPPTQPNSRFPDPNSSPFPQKRPSDSFSPAAKRLDTSGPPQQGPPIPDGPLPPSMPAYSQSGYFPDGERPHPSGPPHPSGHPGGFPFGPRSSQPGPMPPQGMKRDGFPSSDSMGVHPMPHGIHGASHSWMSMKQRSLQSSSASIRGTSSYSGPGTLQQALLGNYPRERYPPSKPVKQSSQLPTISPHKKEVAFPPDSVEATQPTTMKIHMKNGKDVGSVEFWRVMMALKSGLLAESTWALDILSVLLYDDSTVVSFDLRELKGLLEILVDYYRAVLKLIFGAFKNCDVESLKPSYDPGSGERCKKTARCSAAEQERTEKKTPQRTELNHSNPEKMKGMDKTKVVKVDAHAKCCNLVEFYSEKDDSESRRKHCPSSGKEVLPLHIINQFAGTVEAEQCLSQKCVKATVSVGGEEDEEESEWQHYCSEELRLVKDQNHTKTKLVYTSQCRRRPDDHVMVLEDEEMRDDTPAMITKNDAQVSVSKRCKCISNILRGLSFIPANAMNFASHPGLLLLLGRILMLDHTHGERQDTSRKYKEYDSEEEEEDGYEAKEEAVDNDNEPLSRDNWSLDCLNSIREDALVIINNISGRLDFSLYPEPISLPILDGLLHWSVCLSASALDPFPLMSAISPLTPKRLSVEALAKLSLKENNVDMILATPPFERLERLFGYLTQYVGDRKEPVLRELSIVLLSSLAQEETLASRSIACQKSAVSFLLCYLEDSEYAKSLEKDQTAAPFFQGSDFQPPNNNMMRRAASALASLAKVPENHSLFLQHQTRLLNLSMSPLVDRSVRELIAEALFHLGSAGS